MRRRPLVARTVDAGGAEGGQDEVSPGQAGHGAAGARVPAAVVQLVAQVGHLHAGDDLGEGGAGRVDVDGGHVVGLHMVRGGHRHVGQLLALASAHRLQRRSVARAFAARVRHGC